MVSRSLQHRRSAVVNININDHKSDVVCGHPLKAVAVFQTIPAGFFQKLQIAGIVNVLIDIKMKPRTLICVCMKRRNLTFYRNIFRVVRP